VPSAMGGSGSHILPNRPLKTPGHHAMPLPTEAIATGPATTRAIALARAGDTEAQKGLDERGIPWRQK
jgi:hypothetical protein